MGAWGKAGIWAVAALAFGFVATAFMIQQAGRPDFDIFWGAQHAAAPYDTESVRRALAGLSPDGPRLFAYPPTFLALSAPLKLLGNLRVAYGLWVAGSAFAMMAVTRSWFAPLALMSPAVVFAGFAGQTTLFVAAALFAAFAHLDRPRIAGLLIGLALCIKPQLAFAAPVLLLATGRWRPLPIAGLVVLAVAGLATVGWGAGVWSAWLRALPGFLDYNRQHLEARELIHLPAWVRGVLAILAAGFAAFAFRRTGAWETLFAGSVVAALLVSPHAIRYELAALAPAAVAIAVRRDWRLVPSVGLLALPLTAWTLGLAMIATAPREAASWGRRATADPDPTAS